MVINPSKTVRQQRQFDTCSLFASRLESPLEGLQQVTREVSNKIRTEIPIDSRSHVSHLCKSHVRLTGSD